MAPVHPKKLLVIPACTLLVVVLVAATKLEPFQLLQPDRNDNIRALRSSAPSADSPKDVAFGLLGVPWCKWKPGAVLGWSKEDMIAGLREFIPIYDERPIRMNVWGTKIDHSFGLWFVARQLKPDLIVESGSYKGHSTWVLRQARPNAKIVSLSPENPSSYQKEGPYYVDPDCTYFNYDNFTDFGKMDWEPVFSQAGVNDMNKVLLFIDDHQNHLKRVKQARKAGFKHVVFDDNFDTGDEDGDQYTLRQMCDQFSTPDGGHICSSETEEAKIRLERKERGKWRRTQTMAELCGPNGAWWGKRGQMCDNFNKYNVHISYEQHVKHYEEVQPLLEIYWEVPPLAGPTLTQQNLYDPARTRLPLVGDEELSLFVDLGLDKVDKWHFNDYNNMVYVRLRY